MFQLIYSIFLLTAVLSVIKAIDTCNNSHVAEIDFYGSEVYNKGYFTGGYKPNTRECRSFSLSASVPDIKIEVRRTDMEYSLFCRDDYVAMYTGKGRVQKLIKKWCGKTDNFTLSAYGSAFFFIFHSDSDLNTGKGVYFHLSAPRAQNQEKPDSESTAKTAGFSVAGFLGFIGICLLITYGYRPKKGNN